MTRADIIFAAIGVATFGGIVTASVAASGQFSPVVIAIAASLGAGFNGIAAWLARPQPTA